MPSVPLFYTGMITFEKFKFNWSQLSYAPAEIEMLLGADILSHVLLGNTVVGPPGMPIAMNSVFGFFLWVPVRVIKN